MQIIITLSRTTIAIVGLIFIAGCHKSPQDLVPVSGQVTIDGKPVSKGQVTVFTDGHRASIGKLDSEGHFTLSCYSSGDGAPTGNHVATVTAVESIDEHTNRWHAPKKYANKATGVWVVIDGPTTDLEVPLTWTGEKEKGPFIDKF